jgi:putative iron-only hydrogenase system regulator
MLKNKSQTEIRKGAVILKQNICIAGLLINEKSHQAPEVQQVLSKYGTLILHRSGIPYSNCDRGLINVTMRASREEMDNFKAELNRIDGVKVESLCLVDDANDLNICGNR